MQTMLQFSTLAITCVTVICGCRINPRDLIAMEDNVIVLRGKIDTHPERRALQEVGTLTSSDIELLHRYIETGSTRTYYYVLSEYYLKSGSRIIGVVEDRASGTLGGLDITTDDASTTLVRAGHRLITNSDAPLAEALLKAIKNAHSQSPKNQAESK